MANILANYNNEYFPAVKKVLEYMPTRLLSIETNQKILLANVDKTMNPKQFIGKIK